MHKPIQAIAPSTERRLSPVYPPAPVALPLPASQPTAGPRDFTDLPLEMLLQIAGHLQPTDYANFRLTCRQHHRALGHPTALQDLTRRTLDQAQRHLTGLRCADGSGDTIDRATTALRFLEESWGFMCADPELRDMANRLLRRAATSAHHTACLDLRQRPESIGDALLLMQALQGMARRLRPAGDFSRYDRLQSCSRELARQILHCADPAQRAGLLRTLTGLLQTSAGSRSAYGHLFMLAQLVGQVPGLPRHALADLIGTLAASLPQAEAARIGHVLAGAIRTPSHTRAGAAALR